MCCLINSTFQAEPTNWIAGISTEDLLGVLFKNSDEHPHPLYKEVSFPPSAQGDILPLLVAFTLYSV